RINEFHFSEPLAWLMRNAYATTTVSYVTIVIEIAFPFMIVAGRPVLRRLEVFLIEGMHVGIIVGMGLVPFGLIMIGADFACLRDDDYAALSRLLSPVRERVRRFLEPEHAPALAPE